jgi:hypothetical protein
MTEIQYNYAPFNDSISDYFPWQESWIFCSCNIFARFLGDTTDNVISTYRIVIMEEDTSQVITMINFESVEDDEQYYGFDGGQEYGSVGYDKNKRLCYAWIKMWEQDTVEISHIYLDSITYVYRGLWEDWDD